MRLSEGAIGRQESVSAISLALFVSTVFTLDSHFAYDSGNSTYIWLPVSVAAGYGVFLLTALAMERCGCEDIFALMRYALGPALGAAAIYLLAAALLYAAYLPLCVFINAVHNFIFVEAQFATVAAWLIPAVALQAFLGLECVGRTAKCFAFLMGVLLLISFLAPLIGYESFRLNPVCGDGIGGMAKKAGVTVFGVLPALFAPLGMTKGMQGLKNVKKYGLISACTVAGLCAITQFVLALSYSYGELKEMYIPLYRLNMILLGEGYYFRLDKLSLFIWLIACLLAAGFYVYSASLFVCREGAARDVRPAALSLTGTVFFGVLLANSAAHAAVDAVEDFVQNFGSAIVAGLLLLSALISVIKHSVREKKNETA